MYLGIIGVGLCFMLLERVCPDQSLAHSPYWWLRAIAFNLAQLGVVLLGGVAWDLYLQRVSVFEVSTLIEAPINQGLFGYFVTTFVYY